MRLVWLAAAIWLVSHVPLALAQLSPARVMLDSSVRFQTVAGWSAADALEAPAAQAGAANPIVPPEVAADILDDAVDTLGLTGAMLVDGEPQSEAQNDNGDPYSINPAGFDWRALDQAALGTILPLKERVTRRGDRFSLWVRFPVGPGGAGQGRWLTQNPAEYAEHAAAVAGRLRSPHQLTLDGWAVDSGLAANDGYADPRRLSEAAMAAGRSLVAMGLPARLVLPEGSDARASWELIEPLQNESDLWALVGLLSWQLRGELDPYRGHLRDLAVQKEVGTAQTGNDGADLLSLYTDLSVGGASLWVAGSRLVDAGAVDTGALYRLSAARTGFSRGRHFWELRQVLRHVRPGMTRIAAVSDRPSLRSVAFEAAGRRTALVLINNDPAGGPEKIAAQVQGLPDGRYGVSVARDDSYTELGVRQVSQASPLSVDVPWGGVVTAYPVAAANLPPTLVRWAALPELLVRPRSAVTLTALAQDPERDPLHYHWSIVTQPSGGQAALGAPDMATTAANGLLAAGRYEFSVQVSDGTSTVSRRVRLDVVDGNQPPVWALRQVEGGLRQFVPGPLRLVASAVDPENDPLDWTWTLIAQPPAAAAALEPTSGAATSRLVVNGVTVPGRYEFEVAASDRLHQITARFNVDVRPRDSGAPLITSVTAQPSHLSSPETQTRLVAQAVDPGGGSLSYWWSLTSAPRGSRPVLARPGAADTLVNSLFTPGSYVFTVRVANELQVASRAVTVTVGGGEITPTPPNGGPTPTPRPGATTATPGSTPNATSTAGPSRRRIYAPIVSKSSYLK